MKKCKIVSLTNHKGGTAKTTTALNLGHGLTDRGYKVLLVDLDSQANLTDLCGYGGLKISEKECISTALRNKNHSIIPKEVKEGLHLLPAFNDSMFGLEFSLQSLPAKSDFQLQRVLEPIKENYDFIIIDLPPSLNAINVNAYVVSDRLIVPILPDYLSLTGFYKLENKIFEVFDMNITDVVVTRFEAITNIAKSVVDEMQTNRKDLLFKTVIRKNVDISEQGAGEEKYSIFDYNPSSNGAKDYNAFVDEFLTRIK